MKQAYQKPYKELDEDLQSYVTQNNKTDTDSNTTLLNQFGLMKINQQDKMPEKQLSMLTIEDIATAFGLNNEQFNSIKNVKKGLGNVIIIVTDNKKHAKEIEEILRKGIEELANKSFGGLIRISFLDSELIELSNDAKDAFFQKMNKTPSIGLDSV